MSKEMISDPAIEGEGEQKNSVEETKPVSEEINEGEEHQTTQDNENEENAEKTQTEKEVKKLSTAELKKQMNEEKKKKQQAIDDEFRTERLLAVEAVKKGLVIVNVQVCINCTSHAYCTHHSEEKYRNLFLSLREEVHKITTSIEIVKNCGKEWPQIGAFEVQFKDKVLYSKLSTTKWPKVDLLAKKIVDYIQKANSTEKENTTPETSSPVKDKNSHAHVEETSSTN